MTHLEDFVRESNRIENILRHPLGHEIDAHSKLLEAPVVTTRLLEDFVSVIEPGAELRRYVGQNVYIGDHVPLRGGPVIESVLRDVLDDVVAAKGSALAIHKRYETLHPFTDGNGRSGRALWLWMKQNDRRYHPGRLFLQEWYYDTLRAG